MTECPLCSATSWTTTEFPFPLFRHQDFAVFRAGPNRIGECHTCGLVFRIVDEAERQEVAAIFTSDAYGRHEERHALAIGGQPEPVPLARVQARLLAPLLGDSALSFLDIGCFDGKLLAELDAICATADLCGFDVSDRPQFPAAAKFRFVSGQLDGVEGSFDWILMSHSLLYMSDLPSLFAHVRRLLRPSGHVFVQVPDFSAKPASLLLGDSLCHYSPAILNGVFRRMGLEPRPVKNAYFPRDVLVTATLDHSGTAVTSETHAPVESCLAHLSSMATRLEAFGEHAHAGILGTTIEAAFSEHCLDGRVAFFVDENPLKAGGTFHGKPVLHPRDVHKDDVVLVPMGAAGEAVARRLMSAYPGTWECV